MPRDMLFHIQPLQFCLDKNMCGQMAFKFPDSDLSLVLTAFHSGAQPRLQNLQISTKGLRPLEPRMQEVKR